MRGGLWALLPVKPLAAGKSRLAACLGPTRHRAFNRHLLERGFALLAAWPGPRRSAVVSADPAVLRAARAAGLTALPDRGAGDLNRALDLAGQALAARGASAILIIPVDLPWAEPAHLRMFAKALPLRGVALCPDRHGLGTNGLAMRPPGLIGCAFGEASFRAHRDRARQAGAAIRVMRSGPLGFDVDTAADFRCYRNGLTGGGRRGKTVVNL